MYVMCCVCLCVCSASSICSVFNNTRAYRVGTGVVITWDAVLWRPPIGSDSFLKLIVLRAYLLDVKLMSHGIYNTFTQGVL